MYIGLDIGGTKIRAGLLDRHFNIVEVIEQPTNARQTKQAVMRTIKSVVEEVMNEKKLRGIGVAVRGAVDHDRGIVRAATMMPGGFKNVHIASVLHKKFCVPVSIDNDVNCFTLAESELGAGAGKQHVVGVTLGTGIGAGILIGGKLYRGAFGGAAEIGHMVVDPHLPRWNTGQRGSWESVCSGTALTMRYKKKTGKKKTALDIVEQYEQGEKVAKELFREMSEYLSIGFANILHTLNPDVLVVGGGLSKVRFYVDAAITQTPQRLVYDVHKKTKIKYAKLGDNAGLIGAALLLKK